MSFQRLKDLISGDSHMHTHTKVCRHLMICIHILTYPFYILLELYLLRGKEKQQKKNYISNKLR